MVFYDACNLKSTILELLQLDCFTSFVIVNNRARILLEEKDDEKSFETDKMAKRWYKACLNETRLELKGVQPLITSLNKLGGWPVLETLEKDYKTFRWYTTARMLNVEGFSIDTLMKHDIKEDDKNNSFRVFRLDQPQLGLEREYLIAGFNDKYVQNYYQYMVNSAVLLGANKTRAMAELKESLFFEIALANLSDPKEERRDPNKLYNPVTLGELDSDEYKVEGLGQPPSWQNYIAGIIGDAVGYNKENNEYNGNKIVIDSSEKIILRNPQFFKDVLELINQTPPKTVANYMLWRVVKSRMSYLNHAAEDIKQQYDKAKTGKAEKKATWKRCVKSTGFNHYGGDSEDGYNDKKSGGAASSMYVRRYFVPEDKIIMLEMIRYIRHNFEKILDGVAWMDDETRIEAKRKLDKMDELVAYPDEIIDENIMTRLYKGLYF